MTGRWCALATLPGGLWAAAVVDTDQTLTAAVLRVEEGGPRVVAGPVTRDTLDIDPPWNPALRILLDHPAEPSGTGFVVEYDNHYTSTGRSAGSTALHVFVREEARLLLAFTGWRDIFQSWVVPCARPAQVPCRAGWQRRYALALAPRASGGRYPDLLVRDRRGYRVVSRHRWIGDAYRPPSFERTPPFLSD